MSGRSIRFIDEGTQMVSTIKFKINKYINLAYLTDDDTIRKEYIEKADELLELLNPIEFRGMSPREYAKNIIIEYLEEQQRPVKICEIDTILDKNGVSKETARRAKDDLSKIKKIRRYQKKGEQSTWMIVLTAREAKR